MKKLIYHKDSWHFAICKIAYGQYFRPRTNACPYLWKQLIWGLLFFIPLGIICLPFIGLTYILRKFDKSAENFVKGEGLLSAAPLISCLLMGVIIMITTMISIFFIKYKDNEGIYALAIIGWAILILIIIKLLYERRRDRILENPEQEVKPNPIVMGIKAWYDKNCPEVEWKDK